MAPFPLLELEEQDILPLFALASQDGPLAVGRELHFALGDSPELAVGAKLEGSCFSRQERLLLKCAGASLDRQASLLGVERRHEGRGRQNLQVVAFLKDKPHSHERRWFWVDRDREGEVVEPPGKKRDDAKPRRFKELPRPCLEQRFGLGRREPLGDEFPSKRFGERSALEIQQIERDTLRKLLGGELSPQRSAGKGAFSFPDEEDSRDIKAA